MLSKGDRPALRASHRSQAAQRPVPIRKLMAAGPLSPLEPPHRRDAKPPFGAIV
jgi:hypothetical protein